MPKLTSMEDHRNPHPSAELLGIVKRKKSKKSCKMCRWELLIWGLSRCCQTTAKPRKTMLLPTVNPQPLCHRCHLFLGSRRQGPPGLNPHNSNDRRGAECPFSNCRARRGARATSLQQLDPWTVCTEVSVRCKGCSSVNSPACRVCQKLGVYGQFVSIAASVCDVSSGKECQPDTAPSEAAPCEDWLIGKVELNTLNDQQHLHRQQTCWNNW